MRRKRLWLRLGLVAAGCLVGVGLLEVGLWIVDPGHYRWIEATEAFSAQVLVRGPDGVLRCRPGAVAEYLGAPVVIGSHGLRNGEVAVPRPPDTFRILVLGDSVPFGWGVAEPAAFPRALERLLQERPRADGRRYEVVNAGIPGFGLVEEYLWLRDHGLAMQPDVVLHCVIANDVEPLPARQRLVLPAALRSLRTLRLVERLVDDFTRTDATQPGTGLAPAQLAYALDRFVALCDRTTRYVYLDTVGVPEAVAHCAAKGIPRVECVINGEWVRAHMVSPTDPHPGAEGHRWMAQRILGQRAALLGE